ncbi:hypothetical protein [Pseudogracilibacillus sp. SO30301A]|uniref:hypothetical protein n=1 Tax=Pseudogracilibacillus sp. SO30301A TaxID=3098291 RepID=UPI00300E3021
MKSAIMDIESNYKTGGTFSKNKVDSIISAAWYNEEEIGVFQNKFDESPFFIRDVEELSYATEVGAETDFGSHRFGVSANTRGYGYEIDGDDLSAYADYTGFEGRGHFEGKYAESEIKDRVGYGSVEPKFPEFITSSI